MNAGSRIPNSVGGQVLALVGWLLLCFAASGTAVFVSVGGWYAELQKPLWTPPPWLFAPVWTLLYVLMAVAAWLVWRVGGWRAQGRPLGWFLLQWLLNALWTPLFFGLHLTGLACMEIIALWLVIVVTLCSFWRVSKVAALLLVPYLVWVSLATALTFTIWRMNS